MATEYYLVLCYKVAVNSNALLTFTQCRMSPKLHVVASHMNATLFPYLCHLPSANRAGMEPGKTLLQFAHRANII